MLFINVCIILGLGIIFIGIGWHVSKFVKTADEYIIGTGRLGVSFGAASLLAFWITGNTTLAAPESAYTMGILGAIGYGFLGGIAIVLFAPIAKRIHEVIPNGRTIGDFYRVRFDNKNYNLFLILLVIYVFGILMTQGIGGGVILEEIFNIPYVWAVTLSFIIVILYSMLGGFKSVTGVAFFQIILILIAVAGVIPYVFFKVGPSNIYEGLIENNKEMLNLLAPTGLLFMFGGTVMGIGEVFMDNTFWQRAYAIDKSKTVPAFLISGIGWAFAPIAMSTLAFIALAKGLVPAQVNQVAPMVAREYGGPIAGYVFLVVVWSAILSTAAAALNALVSLFLNDLIPQFKPGISSIQLKKYGVWITIIVGVISYFLTLPRFLSMLQMLIFLGVINGAFIFPIVLGLFWKKMNKNAAFWAVILASSIGYYIYYTIGALQGVVASGWISFLVSLIYSLACPEDYNWHKLINFKAEGSV